MAMRTLVCILLVLTVPVQAANPIAKVLEMISDLQTKIIGEGAEAQKVYEEFSEWCEDRSKELHFEIKTENAEIADLNAAIAKETANSAALNAKIEDLAASASSNEADLKAATGIRNKEHADFSSEDKELSTVIDMLTRAHGILQKEMQGGASMLQLQNAGSLTEVLSVMVKASVFSSADAARLTALVQTGDEADEAGAPAAAVYESHSGGLLDTLAGLKEKAEAQLDEARAKETAAKNNFEMLKQSLLDEIKFANKDMATAKKGLDESAENKAKAEGDLASTTKDLNSDTQTLADLHRDCMTKAQDFEAETNSRNDELAAIAKAKEIINEATSFSQVSFLQTSRSQLTTGQGLSQYEAVRFFRDLARKQNSPALTQLANRIYASMHGTGDVFGKIKGLISDMISKLEDEASADADKKAYCDKEISESNVKHEDKTAEISKLSAKIDQMTSKSAKLKEEVATLQKELAQVAASQTEMDEVRAEENSVYSEYKAENDKALKGIQLALKVLRDYYAKTDKAHSAAGGSSSGIIGLLEVCESDVARGLAESNAAEEDSKLVYDTETKDNELTTTTKTQDAKYKGKEAKDLDKAVAEATSDRSGVQDELDAVNKYLDELHGQCDEKVESYAERTERRKAEIAGLKEGLAILENEAALIQTTSHRRLRSVREHAS